MAIDWFTTGAQIINFLVLVWLLKKLLYRPIIGAMESREQSLSSRQQQLDERMKEVQELKLRYQNQLDQLQIQQDELLVKARREAEAEKAQILEKLGESIQQKKAQFNAEMLREQQEMAKAIGQAVAEKALTMSRKILSRLADRKLEHLLIENFVRHLSELPASERKSIRQTLRQASAAKVITSFETDDTARQFIQGWFDKYAPGMALHFERRDFLVCGITLEAGGRSWEWNMDRYLTDLGTELLHPSGQRV